MNPVPMLFGVVCLGVLYTLVGLGQVAPHNSVTAFLLPGAVLVTGVLSLPMYHVIAGPFPPWYLIPTQSSLLLMLGATETLETWQWVYVIVVSPVSIVLAFWWAKVRLASLIGLQEG